MNYRNFLKCMLSFVSMIIPAYNVGHPGFSGLLKVVDSFGCADKDLGLAKLHQLLKAEELNQLP